MTAMKKSKPILIVEDNKADVVLIREAIEVAELGAEIHVVNDGNEAFEFIDCADANDAAPCPVLFIVDLNLPKRSGLEVLDHLRKSRTCAKAFVLVVTSSDSVLDRNQAKNLGANGYFRKPSTYDAYLKLGEIVQTMLGAIEPADDQGGG